VIGAGAIQSRPGADVESIPYDRDATSPVGGDWQIRADCIARSPVHSGGLRESSLKRALIWPVIAAPQAGEGQLSTPIAIEESACRSAKPRRL
jgi:hypothetical protein